MKRFSLIQIAILAGLASWTGGAIATDLHSVLHSALMTHPEVKAAQSKVSAEQQTIKTAKADMMPSLDLQAGFGTQRQNVEDVDGQKYDEKFITRSDASIQLTQNLFKGLSTSNNIKGAKARTEAEQWQLNATQQNVALKIIDAYMDVLEKVELVELAEENLSIHKDIYTQIARRTQQGLTRSSDLIQVEGRRARAQANLVNAHNNLINAKNTYWSLVGAQPDDLEFPDMSTLMIPDDVEHAVSLAWQHNPLLMAQNSSINAAEYAYKSQKSDYLPSVDLKLKHGWENDVNGYEGQKHDSTATIEFSYNLFDGGRDKAQIEERAYQTEENRFMKDVQMRQIEEQVRMSWASLEFTKERKVFLLEHEEASRNTVAAYREQFNIGKRSLLDLLDSENELYQSSNELVMAVYQEVGAHYKLLESMGSLLDNMKIE